MMIAAYKTWVFKVNQRACVAYEAFHFKLIFSWLGYGFYPSLSNVPHNDWPSLQVSFVYIYTPIAFACNKA